jgi:hypothetical protein
MIPRLDQPAPGVTHLRIKSVRAGVGFDRHPYHAHEAHGLMSTVGLTALV